MSDELRNARLMADALMQSISPQQMDQAFGMVAEAIRNLADEIESLRRDVESGDR
jgi:hypothetical protein